jgi:hypothetical protein
MAALDRNFELKIKVKLFIDFTFSFLNLKSLERRKSFFYFAAPLDSSALGRSTTHTPPPHSYAPVYLSACSAQNSATLLPNRINRSPFVLYMQCVYCEAGNGFLNTIWISWRL